MLISFSSGNLVRQKKHQQTFTLPTSDGLPQTEVDKSIFLPNWNLRPEWKLVNGFDHDGKRTLIFVNKYDHFESWNERDLAERRGEIFEKVSSESGFVYRRRKKRNLMGSSPLY